MYQGVRQVPKEVKPVKYHNLTTQKGVIHKYTIYNDKDIYKNLDLIKDELIEQEQDQELESRPLRDVQIFP